MERQSRTARCIAIAGVRDDCDAVIDLRRCQEECAAGQTCVRAQNQRVISGVGLKLKNSAVAGAGKGAGQRQPASGAREIRLVISALFTCVEVKSSAIIRRSGSGILDHDVTVKSAEWDWRHCRPAACENADEEKKQSRPATVRSED